MANESQAEPKAKEKDSELVAPLRDPVTEMEDITGADVNELMRINPTAAAQLSSIVWRRMFMELQASQAEVES